MQKRLLLTTSILLIVNSCFGQAFNLNMLTELFDINIQKIEQTIDHNKWVNKYNTTQAKNPIKITQWRFTDATGKPKKLLLKYQMLAQERQKY